MEVNRAWELDKVKKGGGGRAFKHESHEIQILSINQHWGSGREALPFQVRGNLERDSVREGVFYALGEANWRLDRRRKTNTEASSCIAQSY